MTVPIEVEYFLNGIFLFFPNHDFVTGGDQMNQGLYWGTRLTGENPWLGYLVWSKIILKLSSGKKYVASMSPCLTKLWSIYINIPYIIPYITIFNQYIHFQVFCFTFILPINLNIFNKIVPKSRILVPWYDSTNIYGVCNPS